MPGLKAVLISALINMIPEAYGLCIGFLLSVKMEHCYPTFCSIFRVSHHLEVKVWGFFPPRTCQAL